jgi:hypothetical protein
MLIRHLASSPKLLRRAPTGSSSPSTRPRTSRALCSKKLLLMRSIPPRSASHSVPAGQRTGSRSSLPFQSTCSTRNILSSFGMPTTRG